MPQKTQNLGLEVFDFDTDSSPAFINGVAGLTDSNMHKIDKAITEMIKVNNEGVSLNLITSPSGEELERINDYTFSTDTISLRTPSSANAEERYRELLKATSQEFQSDGNDIVVENGIEYQVLVGANLEGQTVKNIINYNKFTHNTIYNLGDSIFEITPNELYGVNFGMSLDCIHDITIGSTYTVVLDVIENTLDQKMSNAGLGHFPIFLDSIGQIGVIKRKYTPSNADTPYSFYFLSPSARSGKIRFKIQVLEGDWTNKDIGYFEGLNSTKATLTNNGEKYSFYASEEGEVIELNKVGDVADSLEILSDGNGVWTQNTIRFDLRDITKWTRTGTQGEIYWRFYSTMTSGLVIPNTKENMLICDTMPVYPNGNWDKGFEKILFMNDGTISLTIEKSKADTSEELIQHIKDNPIKIIAQKKTPITTIIPKELMPTIATYETNKFSFGDEVKPSKATVDVSVDKIIDLEERVAQLKGVMTSISNLSLLGNYVEDEYNKQINEL